MTRTVTPTGASERAALRERWGTTRRGSLLVAGALALLVPVCAASLLVGGKVTDPAAIATALVGDGDAYIEAVLDARIARTALGILVGAALATAGVLIQGITRNPLGDPGLLGVTTGASAAVVIAAAITGTGVGSGTVWIACIGALATTVVVLLVGWRMTNGIIGLLLTGAVVSAILTALIQGMVLARPDLFDSFRFWVIGSLAGRGLDVALAVAPAFAIGIVLALVLAPSLDAIALGEDVATSLGTPVVAVRVTGIVAAALLGAAATAAAGPISFVGLAVPHLVRALVGPTHRWQVPLAVLLGAVLLVAADVLGRVILRPGEVMVGIVTALVGAPMLLIAVRGGWAAR